MNASLHTKAVLALRVASSRSFGLLASVRSWARWSSVSWPVPGEPRLPPRDQCPSGSTVTVSWTPAMPPVRSTTTVWSTALGVGEGEDADDAEDEVGGA